MSLTQNLTKRELEICKLIAKGRSSKQIAKLLFLSDGAVRNYISSIYEKTGVENRTQLAIKYIAEYASADTDVPSSYEGAHSSSPPDAQLRLVGLPGLPDAIPLSWQNQIFTIGRFDISVGHKQCDFEFGMSTKAVSRRHASIERTSHGFLITDLYSKAGTYVNGNRIPPGEPCSIQKGDLISFGCAGADYVFEGEYATQ